MEGRYRGRSLGSICLTRELSFCDGISMGRKCLQIEGWEAQSSEPYLDTLDIIFPLLFPNPPVRESQQWNYRVLPWRYRGEIPDDYVRLNQKIIANWLRETENVWTYEGEWLARTRLDQILQGEVKGQIEKSDAWINS